MFGFGKKKENLSINPDMHEAPKPVEATAEKPKMDLANMSSEEIGQQVLNNAKEKFSSFGSFLKKGLERAIGGTVKGGIATKEAGAQVGTWAKEGASGAAESLGKGLRAVENAQERVMDTAGGVAEAGVEGVKQVGKWAKEGARDVGNSLAEGHSEDFTMQGERNDALAEMYNQGIDAIATKSKEVYGKAETRVKGWANEVKTGFSEWQKQRAEGKRLKAVESLRMQMDAALAQKEALSRREDLLKKQLAELEGNSGLADKLQEAA